MRSGTVLLTGFDPFDGEALNPSWLAVQALEGERIARHRVAVAQVPTEFVRCHDVLWQAVQQHDPAVVLGVGLAGGRAAISVERVALNLVDARIPDNARAQPIDTAVIAAAPNAYFASVPVKAMVAALRARGIPAEVSHSAGTFVCNALFFGLCHRVAIERPRVRAGFVHIPWLPAQAARHAGGASMSTELVSQALLLCLEVALQQPADAAAISEGTLY